MKKILKSKIFWSIVIILIIGGGVYAAFFAGSKPAEYRTKKVDIGSIIQTVSATGKVKSASEIQLNFKNAGQLSVLNVKKGDTVPAGKVLAQLKASDLAVSVNRAQANVAEARANLDRITAGSTSQDIAVYQATVEKYQSDLVTAQDDLKNTQKTYSQTLENKRQDFLVAADSALTKANISLQRVDDTLNYKGDPANFIVSDLVLEQKVKDNYNIAAVKIDEAQLASNVAKVDASDSNIDQMSTKVLAALNITRTVVDDLGRLLDYVIINARLSQSELDTLKTTINTERTTTNTSLSTWQTSKQDFVDAQINYQTKVNAAQNAIATVEKNLAKAQADLDFKKAPARTEDIALYRARVSQAQADLQLAQAKYDETILRSPIAGVIIEVNFELGEQTNLTQPVIRMLAVDNYEIEVDISESDIAKVAVGNQAEITLDAFNDDQIFSGVVTTINPAQTEIQDVVYYKVTVTFNSDQPVNVKDLAAKIKPGMTANVTIQTAQKDNVLRVPLSAVEEKNGKLIVKLLENNQPQETPVVLGLRGDEGLVEIVSGLTEGQTIITR